MRRLVVWTGLVSVAVVTLPSLADDKAAPAPPPVATPPIVYGVLPQGHFSSQPPAAKRPATIPGGSKADGMWVARPKGRELPANYFDVTVVSSAAIAKGLTTGNDAGNESAGTCLSGGQTNSPFGGDGGPWPSMQEQRIDVAWQTPGPGTSAEARALQPRVQAVHVERFTRTGDGHATIDYADAWVDPVTGGAKSIGKGSVPLTRVAIGPTGLEVYAARDEGKVQFVVRSADPPNTDGGFVSSVSRSMAADLPTGFGRGNSDCGLMRIELSARDHAAEMAQVMTQALLPSLRPPPTDEEVKADPMRKLRAMSEVRRRVLLVNLSSTQSVADPQPVMSVAFGWGGKDEGS
jgi:hypothetical protein